MVKANHALSNSAQVYFSLIIGFINLAARKSVRWEIRRLIPSVVMLLTHTESGPPVFLHDKSLS